MAQWREDGKRKSLSFDDEKSRQTWFDDFIEQREANGVNFMATFDAREWARWLEFKREVGPDADLMQIAVDWKRRKLDSKVPFPEASKRYLAAREAEGMGNGSFLHAKGDLKRMDEFFGKETLAEVTPDRVRELIAWLTKIKKFSTHTVRGHRKRLCALFNWAKREKLVVDNPCESVAAPVWVEEEVSILSIKDVGEVFKTAWKQRKSCVAKLALEAFAGLRFSSAAQVVKEDVNFAEKGVTLPAAKIKTRRRHYIEGLPDNLWVWLTAAPSEAWTITPRQYMQAKSDVFRLAGVKNPGNVLRHSFCSYHVSLHADAARTAVILCHASPRTLYQHYRGKATAADAKNYFGIVPSEGS